VRPPTPDRDRPVIGAGTTIDVPSGFIKAGVSMMVESTGNIHPSE